MSRASAGRAVAVPYVLVRVPLAVLDRLVVRRLPSRSRSRTVFDRGLGVADHWAGLLLADDVIRDAGWRRIEEAGSFAGVHTDFPSRRGLRGGKSYAEIRTLTDGPPRI
jgi:hypothetical protein